MKKRKQDLSAAHVAVSDIESLVVISARPRDM